MTTTTETATITGKRARFGAIPDRYKAFIQQGMVVLVLIMLVVFFSVMNSNFANWGNISSLLLASVVTGIQALGLSFVIATGGIDLTPGFGMAATSVFAALLIAQTGGLGLPIWIGILGALFAGALLGAINGFLVSYVRMQPMIATLAMMMVAWGTALVLADGKTISLRSVEGYDQIAIGQLIPGVPNAVLILIALAIVAGVLMNKTAVGRYSLAIGSNEEATRISGVNTRRWKMLAYVIGGTFTGISGILMSSRLSAAQPTLGQGYEMYAIAAAVIGGTSLRGGRASIFGAVIGAVTIQTIFNGLTVMGVQDQWQKVVLGAVVLLAVFVDIVRRGGKEE
ncbi:ABC transporter permease [Tessaracoccus antarcticus]|uniref:ABC transporter permease n=1 Tax=Tessaracoccus antarcticus TaxID=2479848 RepID=A0A3M0G9L7_9ACTN|nr:ABC transporter permease [Tessaracoccus antarcticus]RMB61645.1 ABC transporter permease [Tessaracoccus antarcticus]